MYTIMKKYKISLLPSVLSLIHVERLQNEFIVNGDDHVMIIHVFDMSSKLTNSLSYYLARFILIFLAVYSVP